MDKKIFMFTGKGGVGKSSVACCHSILSAKKNIKTLLISIDPAHSLADILGEKIDGEIREISNNLSAVEFNTNKILEDKFPSIKKMLADTFRKIDFSNIKYTSNLDMPFISNILSLVKILDIYENEDFENIIIDCPASASTFSYLRIPEMLSWYLERFFGVGKNIVRGLRPIAKYKYKINLPDNKCLNELEKLHKRLIDLEKILKNRSISTIRLVTLAEKMVIEESKRDFSYLKLLDYNVDAIFVNKILGEEDNDFIKKRREIQNRYLKIIDDTFYTIPIYKLPLMKNDMDSIDDIKNFASYFEKIDNLLNIRKIKDKQIFIKKDSTYILSINMVNFGNIDVDKKGLDLEIRLNGLKRIIILPNILKDSYIKSFKYDEDKFLIYFENKSEEGLL